MVDRFSKKAAALTISLLVGSREDMQIGFTLTEVQQSLGRGRILHHSVEDPQTTVEH